MSIQQAKKFGAFAGVFTPSILTILGVIMYMRLGWVVGQSGLILALGIILLSHLISVTTGLSLSSIATDKKIKVGGIYYMLSRSLGLPIGGSIGITIFVGTAFSIALYIIGFCENFLGIEYISELTGLEPSIYNYRIIGSIILIILVIIAFISTSVAIKAQFIVLGAILISLASIFIGFFTTETSVVSTSLLPVQDGFSTITIFAIFFPAVTGFTAGVAMSGDLKNPKKDIPSGTLIAILVGLVVYISLAIVFAVFVDRELLLTDNNFLMKIAWSSPLVIAGIWGATLSSALGGILGGPRILQAISKDKITPKIFARGHGINNEPRNALIITFLLAEIGILIGELDMIAAIVTMFYIAAYGFINLAFALEKWASTDFRPTFKISQWVGIIGFIACFAVMFKIDTLAMLGALVILAGIYFYISRKKIALEYGDVWQSVWSTIIRSILNRMDQKGLEERNWRPNIIMFSGGTKMRPYLIELGKDLAGKQGLLSNFDLILNKSAKVLFKKHEQSIENKDTKKPDGLFTRRHECKNIYEGIEAIASTYGFSGVEPNTVLLGWARQSENPVRFVNMIKILSDLDLNILMLDYDKEQGFGNYERIDIWCRGGGNNCNLMLSLIKFIWLSKAWENAKARILIINPVNEQKEKLISDTEKVLDSLRMEAEIKVLNNQIEQRPVNEIIQVESSNSDLVFFGIPEVNEGQEDQYVESVNRLCHNIGSTILVKASSYFKNIEIGQVRTSNIQQKSEFIRKGIELIVSRESKIPEISYPDNPILSEHIHKIYDKIKVIDETLNKNYFAEIFNYHNHSIRIIKNIIVSKLAAFNKYQNEHKLKEDALPGLYDCQQAIISESKEVMSNLTGSVFNDQQKLLSDSIEFFISSIENLILSSPEFIIHELSFNDLKPRRNDSFKTLLFKIKKQASLKKGKTKYKIEFRKLLKAYFDSLIFQTIYEVLENLGLISFQYLIKLRKMNELSSNSSIKLEKNINQEILNNYTIETEIGKAEILYEEFAKLNETSLQSIFTLLLNKTFYVVQQISNDMKIVNTNSVIKKQRKEYSRFSKIKYKLLKIPDKWLSNQELLNNMNILESELIKMVFDLRLYFVEHKEIINSLFENEIIYNINKCDNILKENSINDASIKELNFCIDKESFQFNWKNVNKRLMEKVLERTSKLPKSYEIMQYEVYENFKAEQFDAKKSVSLLIRDFCEFTITNDYLKLLYKNLGEAQLRISNCLGQISDLINELKDFHESGKNSDPLYDVFIDSMIIKLGEEKAQIERIKTKLLNQISERRNSLSDSFTLSSILRKTNTLKRFLKK